VRTHQKASTSANRSRNYEKIPPVQKPLYIEYPVQYFYTQVWFVFLQPS